MPRENRFLDEERSMWFKEPSKLLGHALVTATVKVPREAQRKT